MLCVLCHVEQSEQDNQSSVCSTCVSRNILNALHPIHDKDQNGPDTCSVNDGFFLERGHPNDELLRCTLTNGFLRSGVATSGAIDSAEHHKSSWDNRSRIDDDDLHQVSPVENWTKKQKQKRAVMYTT